MFFKQVTKAVHLCVVSGSLVGVYQPWTVNEYGYTTSVVAKLFQVEATTSLAYRQLIEADAIDVRGYNNVVAFILYTYILGTLTSEEGKGGKKVLSFIFGFSWP